MPVRKVVSPRRASIPFNLWPTREPHGLPNVRSATFRSVDDHKLQRRHRDIVCCLYDPIRRSCGPAWCRTLIVVLPPLPSSPASGRDRSHAELGAANASSRKIRLSVATSKRPEHAPIGLLMQQLPSRFQHSRVSRRQYAQVGKRNGVPGQIWRRRDGMAPLEHGQSPAFNAIARAVSVPPVPSCSEALSSSTSGLPSGVSTVTTTSMPCC